MSIQIRDIKAEFAVKQRRVKADRRDFWINSFPKELTVDLLALLNK